MMKNYIKFSMMIMTSVSMMSAVMAQEYKIATVSINSLVNDYYRKDIELVSITEESDRINKANEKKKEDLMAMKDELVALGEVTKDPTASDDAKKKAAADYKAKYDQLINTQKEYTEVAQRHTRIIQLEAKEVLATLTAEVLEVVAKYSEEKGYDLVYDKSGLSNKIIPTLYYSKDASDITADVLTVLNKDAPK